ncbi:hypothetical protein HK099_007396 [Clydaea vesicula]|uniref:Dynamin N-terminal domain-containing protein n=1 Tax=Clydaea vesicula TaxID=447962 RepID=A0AAD5XTR9_9FUNG|nr:hypothetical protein HK099_007396 [Clydaea vesicula]
MSTEDWVKLNKYYDTSSDLTLSVSDLQTIQLNNVVTSVSDIQIPELNNTDYKPTTTYKALISEFYNDDISTLFNSLVEIKNKIHNIGKKSNNISSVELDIQLPRIAVVGNENCGKSSVLSRLCHLDIFPKNPSRCTILPLEFRLENKTEVELRKFYHDQFKCCPDNLDLSVAYIQVENGI